MISLDAYRLSIGSFNSPFLLLNLQTICQGLKIGILVSSKLLKPTRFITAILLTCGDVESNPGPTISISTVKGYSNQGNLNTEGQCVCNSLASLCYSNRVYILHPSIVLLLKILILCYIYLCYMYLHSSAKLMNI